MRKCFVRGPMLQPVFSCGISRLSPSSIEFLSHPSRAISVIVQSFKDGDKAVCVQRQNTEWERTAEEKGEAEESVPAVSQLIKSNVSITLKVKATEMPPLSGAFKGFHLWRCHPGDSVAGEGIRGLHWKWLVAATVPKSTNSQLSL